MQQQLAMHMYKKISSHVAEKYIDLVEWIELSVHTYLLSLIKVMFAGQKGTWDRISCAVRVDSKRENDHWCIRGFYHMFM